MARKAKKSFKDLLGKKETLRKTKIIEIMEGYPLRIKSLSYNESNKKFDLGLKPPTKYRPMNDEERKEWLTENTKVSETMLKMFKVAEYDFTDEEYLEKLNEASGLATLLTKCKYIDMEFKPFNDSPLWQELELKNNEDYIGLVNWLFNELEVGKDFVESLDIAIGEVEGKTIFNTLGQISEIYGGDMIGLMGDLADMLKQRNAKADSNESGDK